MHIASKKKIVILGMMAQMPVAGVVWQTMHYLIGFQRLGYDVYYVEAHGCTPTELMQTPADDSSALAAAYLDRVFRRFDLSGRWCLHALHDDGRCYGISEMQLAGLYRSASLLINLCGGTVPRPEHYETGRLVYLQTDPVQLEIELHANNTKTIAFLEPHCAFFTFGENLGGVDCSLPQPRQFHFWPTRQPVVLDLWRHDKNGVLDALTTVGNWRQTERPVEFGGEVYQWSKHFEFLKFIDLPLKTSQRFELALSSCNNEDRQLLEEHGWRVKPSLTFSKDADDYREYITSSHGEFTVAKDQNIRFRTGWFSDRSATYLAAGRPVITQETGFSNILPTGRGLFAFSSMSEILAAVDSINSNYAVHCRAAREIAHEYFAAEVVLSSLLDKIGLS